MAGRGAWVGPYRIFIKRMVSGIVDYGFSYIGAHVSHLERKWRQIPEQCFIQNKAVLFISTNTYREVTMSKILLSDVVKDTKVNKISLGLPAFLPTTRKETYYHSKCQRTSPFSCRALGESKCTTQGATFVQIKWEVGTCFLEPSIL